MELDDRKIKILEAIIKNYLETGEPVGSRTISKYADLNLSSATIRNEMADLEEMGYILQPHTSAGRIPSDKGYRLYVDNMISTRSKELVKKEDELNAKEKKLEDVEEYLDKKIDKIDVLLQNMAKVLATNTNYATMISGPSLNKNKLKFLQLTKVSDNQMLCVLVISGNVIKNRMIEVKEPVSDEDVLKLNILLNSTFTGLTLEEINVSLINKLTAQVGENADLVKEILEEMVSVIEAEDELPIYTSGATNIFKYPELSDSENARNLISTLEEKEELSAFVKGKPEDENPIQVYIGKENQVQTMKDCSVVTATYELEEGLTGTIGIIGPKRMDYNKVIDALSTVKEQLDSIYRKK